MKRVALILLTFAGIGCGQVMDTKDTKRELKISIRGDLPPGAKGPVCGCGGKEIKGAEMEKALNSLIKNR
ncbi:MAG: hypothetical protein NZ527_06925 [Hydrogenobacter thermophilus]|uniref:hypothetical protein n=1 Tax=Hydrogenobacter thermophilus TaxID=940 RepID=UPI001C757CD3|nr:hypothetical protein [Hydrogenobacter thermophilus]MCS7285436.1 hypothetical protein [Hydrogenobacter thermophilus]QWK19332.1 MAG: hypothetical protein KNN13_07465 [Hydrogenobacter thermophilus]